MQLWAEMILSLFHSHIVSYNVSMRYHQYWIFSKTSSCFFYFVKCVSSSLYCNSELVLKSLVVWGLLLWWLHVTSVQTLRGFCSGLLMVSVIVALWHSNIQQCLQTAHSVHLESLCCWKSLNRYWTCSLVNLCSVSLQYISSQSTPVLSLQAVWMNEEWMFTLQESLLYRALCYLFCFFLLSLCRIMFCYRCLSTARNTQWISDVTKEKRTKEIFFS